MLRLLRAPMLYPRSPASSHPDRSSRRGGCHRRGLGLETGPNEGETGPNKGETGPNKGETGSNKGQTGPNKGLGLETGPNGARADQSRSPLTTHHSLPRPFAFIRVHSRLASGLALGWLLLATPVAAAPANDTPGPLEAPITPAEGSAPRRNPPAFVWRPEAGAATYTLQLSPSTQFPEGQTQTFEGLALNLHNPPRRLAPGTWHWRCRAVSAQGTASEWRPARSFRVTADASVFEVPALPELAARIPQGHPRIFATAATLEAFRARRSPPGSGGPGGAGAATTPGSGGPGGAGAATTPSSGGPGGGAAAWQALEASARQAVGGPLPAEPEPYKDGKWEVTQWRKTWNTGASAADQMERQAFAYLVSGDRAFADEARRWMLHVCTWDPAGTTSHQNNDMASRPILYKMARAYDWGHDALSQAERDRVLGVLRVRGEEMFRKLRARHLEARPYDSHLISSLEFMGEVALALYGDLPEARAWFEYAIPLHLAIFPPWGGDDGGWSQGVSYWKWSTTSALLYAEALRSALGVDVFQKPWYQATGFFKLYCHPPYSRMSAFGDHSDVPPDAADRMNMDRLGSVYREGAFKWYAARVPGSTGGIAGYLWGGDDTPIRPPAGIPSSRLFADVGIAALHTRLWDAANNVTLLLKSSPYGSYNHGYAEQNNFVLDAFGEPLVVSSGYYPWYMSPHHREWTHQTKAQNCLLVDGKGQPLQDKTAAGRIAAFHAGEGYDYVVGDATAAYARLLGRCLRRVLFIRSGLFVMLDDAEAHGPAAFQWMLHSLEQMEVDEGRRAALIRRGRARLSVQWLEPAHLTFSQTDQFPFAPEEREAHKPNQWHLTVTTADRSETGRFLTLLAPYRAGEEGRVPAGERLAAPGVLGMRAGEDIAGFRLPDAGGAVVLEGISSDGEAFAARRSPSGSVARAFLAGGRSLSIGAAEYLALGASGTASLRVDGETAFARVDLPEAGEVKLRVPVSPRRVSVDGKPLPEGGWTWQAETRLLALRLEAGEHRVEVNGQGHEPLPAPPSLVSPSPPDPLSHPGERGSGGEGGTRLSVVRTTEGSLLAYGLMSAPAGPYRLEGAQRARVQVSGQAAGQGTLLWLGGTTELTLESAPGEMPPALRLLPVPLGEPLVLQPVPEQALAWPEVVTVEAEAMAAQWGGNARAYTTREFLSGGAGLTEWRLPGHRVEWRVRVPKAGHYLLLLKAAVWEEGTRRLVSWDGGVGPEAWRPLDLPRTGGFGAKPEEWGIFRVAEPVALTAGEHTLALTALSGAMNLDLLAIMPAE